MMIFIIIATSHHWTVREFMPDMLKRNSGHIVTIASISGTILILLYLEYIIMDILITTN